MKIGHLVFDINKNAAGFAQFVHRRLSTDKQLLFAGCDFFTHGERTISEVALTGVILNTIGSQINVSCYEKLQHCFQCNFWRYKAGFSFSQKRFYTIKKGLNLFYFLLGICGETDGSCWFLSVLALVLPFTASTVSFAHFLFGKLVMSSIVTTWIATKGAKFKSMAQV